MSSKLIRNLKKGVFAVGRGLRYVGTALLFPVNISFPKDENGKRQMMVEFPFGKIALSTMVYFVVQPLSIFLFPRAETVMKREGIDPNFLPQITTAKNIRIIPDNLAGKAYYIFNAHPLLQPENFAQITNIFNKTTAAFHDPTSPGVLPSLLCPDLKKIYLKDYRALYAEDNEGTKTFVETNSWGSFTFKESVSAQDMFVAILIHELRHTSPAQDKHSALEAEGDADYYAAAILSISKNHPAFSQDYLNQAVITGSSSKDSTPSGKIHDTALYLYLRINNMSMPSEKVLIQANMDAAPAIEAYNDIWLHKKDGKEKFDAATKHLSELAALKVALYIKAFKAQVVPTGKTPKNAKPLKVS